MLANRNTARKGRARDERGTALAELAIVMPVLLVLILGMVDFGKAFHEWIDTTHMAAVGARLAAVNYCPNPLAADCGWSDPLKVPGGTACPVTGNTSCLAWYIADQADIRELRPPGRSATSTAPAPAQNPAQVCIYYPNGPATQVGDPVRIEVKVVYRWLKYLTNQVDLGSTQILGKATMRLESLPPQPVPVATSPFCWPTTGGAGT